MTNEEAIRYFKRHIDLYCVDGISREAEEMAIKALERTIWIPVSEELPELKQRILVSYETMDDDKKVDITTYDKYGFLLGKAHAWMPLPKPYEPQESEG